MRAWRHVTANPSAAIGFVAGVVGLLLLLCSCVGVLVFLSLPPILFDVMMRLLVWPSYLWCRCDIWHRRYVAVTAYQNHAKELVETYDLTTIEGIATVGGDGLLYEVRPVDQAVSTSVI